MEMIEKQEAIHALKAIKYGLWEIDIPSPGNCLEYIEHHKQIKDMMEITDGWIKKLMELPSVQPKADEWCTECPAYDHEKHNCPRFNRVIRQTVEEIQPERKKGKWLLSDEQRREDTDNDNYRYVCSNCLHSDIHAKTQEVPYCWWCGADMRGENE